MVDSAVAKVALLTAPLMFLLFTLLVGFPQAEAQQAGTGVTFTIVTSDDYRPIKGAEIRVNGTIMGTTNTTGKLAINTMGRNSIQNLQVLFRGFTVYNNANFNASNMAQVTLRVNVTTMRISVKTVLENPVPNVRLVITYGSYNNETTSGSDGWASIPMMPNTTYTIEAFYRGYPTHPTGGFIMNYGGAPIKLTLNLYSIRIQVQDMEGNPVPSATVKVWYGARQPGNTTGFESAETDHSGVAVVDRLPAGSYPLNVEYRGETVYQSPAAVQVVSGGVSYLARTDLVRYRVRVLDFDGVDLITGINLEGRLYRDDTQYGDTATTSSGELSFGLVRSRTYILVVKMGDLEVFRGEVTVPQENSIRGRFYDAVVRVDASGTPSEKLISTVAVKLSISGYHVEANTVNGAARFNNMPAGTYSYEISRGPYIIGSGNLEVTVDEAKLTIRPTLYTLRLKLTNDVEEGIPASVQLKTYDDVVLGVYQASGSGEVTVSGLIPILYRGLVTYRNINVHDGFEFLMDQDNKELTVKTKVYNVVFRLLDYDGEVELDKAELSASFGQITEAATSNSTGRAAVKNLPIGDYIIRVNYFNVFVHEETVRVDSSREITVKARGVIDVEVEVVDDDSNPLESGNVQISLAVARFKGNVSEGKARFNNIPAGNYRVLIEYKGFTVYDSQATFTADEEKIRVSSAVYYLRLTVVKSDGSRLASANVAAIASAKKIAEGYTDSAGRVELKLPRGDFSIEVVYQDTTVYSQTLSVTQSIILNIKAKVYRVDFRILTPDGLPVQGAEVSVSRGDRLVERSVTDSDGKARLYLAEEDYRLTMKIGGYTYTSSYSSKQDRELVIVHVEEKPQWQGVVLAATATVSFASVFGLIRWGRLKPGRRQRRRPPEVGRYVKLKRTRPPAI